MAPEDIAAIRELIREENERLEARLLEVLRATRRTISAPIVTAEHQQAARSQLERLGLVAASKRASRSRR